MLTEVLLKSQSEGERSSHSERERNERTTRGGKGKVLGWLLWKWLRASALSALFATEIAHSQLRLQS
jgi:hypothetical protein